MWVQISAGLAPIESCRFVYLFLNKLKDECQQRKVGVEVISSTPGMEKNTYKSVFLKLTGEGARDFAKNNEGSMQWICRSDYRPNHKRNNWFIEVEILDDADLPDLSLKGIKIETMRCSGNGGQNVNKLETGVRVTHIPTGLITTAQEERSQLQNKKLALLRLQKKLEELKAEQQNRVDFNRWKKHQRIKRGEAVRIFKGVEFREFKNTTLNK